MKATVSYKNNESSILKGETHKHTVIISEIFGTTSINLILRAVLWAAILYVF